MSDQSDPASTPAPRRRRGWLFVTTIALLAALTGAAASQAIGHGPGGYWHRHGFMGPLDPAQAEERADRFVRHAAIELDATAEQQDKLRTIAKNTVKDLLPMRDKARAGRDRARELLTKPTIDRAAIEAFRAEQMALAEAASKRIAQALGDAAEVLTPEQRRKVDDFVQWRRNHWRPWRSWHRG